ncbi:non-specific lipid transfer protein GPI-anchored 9 [Salvia hispanica]|uniref:non-specific lipid transfer protein GPI-anchored 9 n=1 Tax=Salvia hispanica TaxID=49212 RepID=UPI002009C83A|nr:non-specific lipid transfer protein GPI-anchored 9 [Salvia hispanica]
MPRVMIPKTKAAKMNMNMKLACLMLVVVVMAQESTAHPCGSTFFSALVQLIPCRSAVAPFSPIPPTEACCASIKALGQPCLCVLVNGPPISGVDRTMATQLPEKCTANFEPCETSK